MHKKNKVPNTLWCGVAYGIIGPFFFYGTVNKDTYLRTLQEEAFPLLNPDGHYLAYFQQDGAPAHYSLQVPNWLDTQFPGHWIGRRVPVEWPPRSPDLTPLDYYLWGHLKAMVYAVKIRSLDHLK